MAVSTRAASMSFSHVLPTLMMWMPSWRRRQMYSSIMWSLLRVPMWHWALSIFWMSSSLGCIAGLSEAKADAMVLRSFYCWY